MKKITQFLLCFFLFTGIVQGQLSVDYVIVGGGGGGGGGNDRTSGGGSGGQARTGTSTINSGSFPITVGNGGTRGTGTGTHPSNGGSSTFNSITSIGGGSGGWRIDNSTKYAPSNSAYAGGSHHYQNTASVNGSIAYNGGAGYDGGSVWRSGGGGGAGGAGVSGTGSAAGGSGVNYALRTGSNETYSRGGNGGNGNSNTTGSAGGNNTGNGGNGGSSTSGASTVTGGAGGSGIVVIRYASNTKLGSGGTETSYSLSGTTYQVHTFTSSGTFIYTGVISTHPSTSTQNICINGSSTALSVVATGTTITYQWYSNTTASNTGGTLISGATSSTYTPPTNVAATRYYYCYVTNSTSNQTSNVSGAIVVGNPSVAGTISGANTVTAGTNSTLLTLNSYTGSVQWQSSTNGSTFSNISGATSGTYTATNLSVTTYYRVVVTSGGCAPATSASVTVLVLPSTTPVSTTLSITGTGTTLSIPNNTHTVVDNALVVTSNGNISGFAVAITENYSSGDVLGYTGTLPTGVTTSGFSTTSRSIVFKGSASAADWQTFLRTITLRSTSVTCNPEARSVSFTVSTNFYNYFNGHYYEYVSSGRVWTDAKAHAESKTFFGRQGYLATINSAEENAYINKLIGQNSWLGGSDNFKMINQAVGYTKYANQSQAEGKFHWVTGPEKGTQLTNSNGNSGWRTDVYNRWAGGEANNYNTGFYDVITATYGEHYLHAYSSSSTWNDFPNDRRLGSIIEYGDMPGDNPVNSIAFTRNLTIQGMTGGSITGGGVTVCSGLNSTNLTLSGATGTVARWEFSDDNFLTNISTISNTTSSYNAVNITSTTYYRAVMINGSCTLATPSTFLRADVTKAGSISAMTNQVCVGSNANLFLSGAVGAVSKWQITSNPVTTITDISSTNTSLSHTISSAGNYLMRAIVTNGGCSVSDTSEWYPVDVSSGGVPDGGTISSAAHCGSANSGMLSLSDATGSTYVWESSTNNGSSWSNAGSTTNSFIYNNISRNTQYRVLVSNGSCGSSYSSVGEIVIYGTTICEWTGAGNNNLWTNSDNWCSGIIATNGRIVEINPYSPSDPELTIDLYLDKLDFNSSSRKVILGNFKLGAETVIGNDSLSYVQTNGTGYFEMNISNNQSYVFPVGNSSYNPVTITNRTGAADTFAVNVMDVVRENGLSGTPLNNKMVNRTWDINKLNANAGSGVDMEFAWSKDNETSVVTTPVLNHYNSVSSEWEIPSMGSVTVTTKSLSYTGYTGTFSPFAIGGDEMAPLPVNLLNFSADKENATSVIKWQTVSEINNSHFEVLRSTDGQNWEVIGTVSGAGNSFELQTYQMLDRQPSAINYYRLRQVDFDGEESLSDIREVIFDKTASNKLTVYPNPSTGQINIVSNTASTYTLHDMTGRQLISGIIKGTTSLSNLAPGMYLLMVHSGDQTEAVKVIVH